MDFSVLVQGFITAFSISAPVGPVGVLVIRRTLAEGVAAGVASGFGCATSISLFAAIAAFGLTTISGPMLEHQYWLRLLGGVFLVYLGYVIFVAPAVDPNTANGSGGPKPNLVTAYLTTVALTLVNPPVIIYFLAILAGGGLTAATLGGPTGATFTAGAFIGSVSWWCGLSLAVGLARARLNQTWLRWANRISGSAIAGFGVYIFAQAFG